MDNLDKPKNTWNAALYQNRHSFVWEYAEDLLQLLHPQPGELILDLGCGTGQLTDKIAQSGAEVWGIDSAATMIDRARENYPHLRFDVADARNFRVNEPLDAVFSNATLHWVKDAEAAIAFIHQALKSGGRFVVEFGGKGNVEQIVTALYHALEKVGISHPQTLNPWYYPSIGEYATKLETQGFDVIYGSLFDRITPLGDGDRGMQNWLQMFANNFLLGLSSDQQTQVIEEVESFLRPKLYDGGNWIADYRRIRIVAIKASTESTQNDSKD